MKVLIADPVAPLADAMFSVPNPTLSESWLGALAYTMQLYFDFAGYSNIAIGTALPEPAAAGDAVVVALPTAEVRSFDAYAMENLA